MPVRPAAAGVVKHEILWIYTDQLVSTFWTYRAATADMAARIEAERVILKNWCDVHWRGGMNDSCSISGPIKSWDMSTVPPTKYADYPIVPALNGQRAGGNAAPSTINMAVSLRTQAVGATIRGINGRVFHTGFLLASGTDFAFNQFAAARIVDVRTRFDALRTALNAAGVHGRWCVVSYQDGGVRGAPVYRAVPLVLPVDHLLVNGVVQTQRRRRPRQASYTLGT